MRRNLVVGATIAGFVVLVIVVIRRIFDPRTPLHYPFPPRAWRRPLPLTPPCTGGDAEPTHPAVEGPVYIPNTPQRTVIRDADSAGEPLTIDGFVLTPRHEPIPGAVLDFWNCDGDGVYDTDGFRLRGHQYTDAAGRYHLETVKPGDYHQFGIRRTPHVHVKVQAPGTSLLTTQLFFPGEPLNEQDLFLDDALIMKVGRGAGGALRARFDFVLQ